MPNAAVALTSLESPSASRNDVVLSSLALQLQPASMASMCTLLQPFQYACCKLQRHGARARQEGTALYTDTLGNQHSDGTCLRTPQHQKRLGLCVCVRDAASLGCRACTHHHHRQTATPPSAARGHHGRLRCPPGSPEHVSQGARNRSLLTWIWQHTLTRTPALFLFQCWSICLNDGGAFAVCVVLILSVCIKFARAVLMQRSQNPHVEPAFTFVYALVPNVS